MVTVLCYLQCFVVDGWVTAETSVLTCKSICENYWHMFLVKENRGGGSWLTRFGWKTAILKIKYASEGTDLYPHMLILRNGTSLAWSLHRHISTVMFTSPWAWPTGRFFRYRASGGAKFTKICDSLPLMLMNYRAICDAASFILGGEIPIHTNTHTQNSKLYIHTLPIGMCG